MSAKESYTTGADGSIANTANIYGVYRSAQIFTAEDSTERSGVKLLLFRTGSPGTLTCTLQSVTSGRPNGSVLATGMTDGDTLTTDAAGEWREIVFDSPYTLTTSTLYAIVLSAVGDSSNKGRWQADLTSPEYSGGTKCWSNNSGASWTIDGTKDMMFEMQGGSGTTDISGSIDGVSVWSGSLLNTFSSGGTLTGVSVFSATISTSQTSAVVTDTQPIFYIYLVAVNNNRIYYEAIE